MSGARPLPDVADHAEWSGAGAGRPRSVVTVPIAALKDPDSPRVDGENCEHARLLAESESELPPIIVHRGSMRVIDGAHRLRAAKIRGQTAVEVTFFDGDDEEAFLLAVETNIKHGLPLSQADRKAAARRVIVSRPQWSDRAIAKATGLSPKTIASIRQRATAELPQSRTRVGQDGRVRPLDSSAARMLASELIQSEPEASIRQIAARAGVSQATVRDVRDRLQKGEHPVPEQRNRRHLASDMDSAKDWAAILHSLKRDPSLRYTEVGRGLIRLLDSFAIDDAERQRIVGNVPAHCSESVADLADKCASIWRDLASALRQRGQF